MPRSRSSSTLATAGDSRPREHQATGTQRKNPHRALRAVPKAQLAVLALLAALKAAGLVLLAQAVSAGIARLVAAPAGAGPETAPGQDLATLMSMGCSGVLLRAVATWGIRYASQRVALGTKEHLRQRLVGAALAGKIRGRTTDAPQGPGAVAALASRGLDGLDEYFATFLPALVTAAVVPVAVGARILAADWVSAVVLVCTVPLVPLFMALIGLHTRDRVAKAAAGLDALSNQLAELAQGLPALIGLRRARERRQGLAAVSQRYRSSTMATLRTAFLSGLALELIATISVAVVAVFIGVRLVYGTLGLEVGLLALILAPEVFLPLRAVGSAFHSSEDGVEAMRRAEDLLDGPDPEAGSPARRPGLPGPGAVVSLRGLSICYAGAPAPALDGYSLELPAGAAEVLDGPSGSGKSTLLHALAGLLPGDAELSGSLAAPGPGETAWIGQHPRFTEATAREELRLHAPAASDTDIGRALGSVHAAHLEGRPLVQLSPGELRRIAVARGLLRVTCGATLLLADEPTAHLDPASADAVRSALAGAVRNTTMVVATHDRVLSDLLRSARHQAAGARDSRTVAGPGRPPAALRCDVGRADAGTPPPAVPVESPRRPHAVSGGTGSIPGPTSRHDWGSRIRLLRSLGWWRSGLGGGVLLAAASVLSGAALTAVSGWLIVNASTRPPMMILMVAIVGVRFFGLSRSVLRYLQQLAVHRAVLGWATTLRTRLWDALSERPARWGRLTRGGEALTHLVADVDELRDATPRVLVPIPAAVLAWLGSVATAAILVPGTTLVLVAAGLVGFLVGPLLALQVERGSVARAARHRSWIAGRVSQLLGASGDLRANGRAADAADGFARRDRRESAVLLRAAAGTGVGESVAVLASGFAAMACIAVVARGGTAGAADAALLAVVALLALALQEPFANAAEAAARIPLLGERLDAVSRIIDADDGGAPAPLPAEPAGHDSRQAHLEGLELDGVAVTWVGEMPAVSGISARVGRGEWLSITGPSGSGKSSLLAVLLGLVPPSRGTLRLLDDAGHAHDPWTGGAGAAALLGRVAWCPQEAHLFDSTLRNNLCLGRAADDPASDAELHLVLAAVGLGPWFAGQADGLSTRIGNGGHRLSGGQRQRLAVARALVARADAILLDEPTAHLGQDEAAALVADLRRALDSKAVVMVTHDPAMAEGSDVVLRLPGSRQSVPATA